MSRLRHYFRKVQLALRPPFYLKRQTFVARYQVMLKNIAEKPNQFAVVVPIAKTSANQRVASEPRFIPAIGQIETDERFGNQYAIWRAELAPGESRLFTQHFTVSVDPVHREIPTDAFVSGYGDRPDAFFSPSAHIQSDDEKVKVIAQGAVAGASDVRTLVSNLNEEVIRRLEYGNPINSLYSALDALKQIKVDCGGYDSLFVALCIASGIPARIVSGFWAGYQKNDMHAWAEFQLPSGEWIPVDPSTESLARAGRTHKLGKIGTIGSDRIVFSIGCDVPLRGLKKGQVAAILQHPFVEASLGDRSYLLETRVETTKA